MNPYVTDIPGVLVGHAHREATGCTVIIPPPHTVGGVDVRGGGPGTRETDLLKPENLVEEVHGILLTGGSAYGLDAASGVMEALRERGRGMDTGFGIVPIVPAAVLFDLPLGDSPPDRELGREAVENACREERRLGCVGAGRGATLGKILGPENSMKSGLGSWTEKSGDLMVSAIVAVNAFGDLIEGGKVIAGPRQQGKIRSTVEILRELGPGYSPFAQGQNTTIGVIVTNGTLTKSGCTKVAAMAHDGFARALEPVHTGFDGDTVFTLATGEVKGDVSLIGTLGAKAMEKAIHVAVKEARSLKGLPALYDITHS